MRRPSETTQGCIALIMFYVSYDGTVSNSFTSAINNQTDSQGNKKLRRT